MGTVVWESPLTTTVTGKTRDAAEHRANIERAIDQIFLHGKLLLRTTVTGETGNAGEEDIVANVARATDQIFLQSQSSDRLPRSCSS
jgi:hypothetical protein